MCMSLSERTQVLLSPAQRDKVERLAASTDSSVGAVIRRAIDAFDVPDPDRRRQALDDLLAIKAPVDDWAAMEAEIVRGATG